MPLGITDVNRAAGFLDPSDEVMRDAVQQIRVRGYSVREVSQLFSDVDHEAENRRLKREFARVTEEQRVSGTCSIGHILYITAALIDRRDF